MTGIKHGAKKKTKTDNIKLGEKEWRILAFIFSPNDLKSRSVFFKKRRKIIKILSPKNEKLLMGFKPRILTRLFKSVLKNEGNTHTL